MELRSAKGKNILQRDSPRTMGTQLGRNYLSALKHLHLHPLFANQRPIRGRTTRKDTTLPPEPPLLSAAGCDVLEVVPRIVPKRRRGALSERRRGALSEQHIAKSTPIWGKIYLKLR